MTGAATDSDGAAAALLALPRHRAGYIRLIVAASPHDWPEYRGILGRDSADPRRRLALSPASDAGIRWTGFPAAASHLGAAASLVGFAPVRLANVLV